MYRSNIARSDEDLDLIYEGFYDGRELGHKMADLKDFAEELYEALYVSGNTNQIEGCLEEILSIVESDYSIENKDLKVSNMEKNRLFNWALGYQRAHIDHSMGTNRSVENYL